MFLDEASTFDRGGSGEGSGCGGMIVPPQGTMGFFGLRPQNDKIGQNDTYVGLVLWWIIFAAPGVLVAVRVRKK